MAESTGRADHPLATFTNKRNILGSVAGYDIGSDGTFMVGTAPATLPPLSRGDAEVLERHISARAELVATIATSDLRALCNTGDQGVSCDECANTGTCRACKGRGMTDCECSDCGDMHEAECGDCGGEGECSCIDDPPKPWHGPGKPLRFTAAECAHFDRRRIFAALAYCAGTSVTVELWRQPPPTEVVYRHLRLRADGFVFLCAAMVPISEMELVDFPGTLTPQAPTADGDASVVSPAQG